MACLVGNLTLMVVIANQPVSTPELIVFSNSREAYLAAKQAVFDRAIQDGTLTYWEKFRLIATE